MKLKPARFVTPFFSIYLFIYLSVILFLAQVIKSPNKPLNTFLRNRLTSLSQTAATSHWVGSVTVPPPLESGPPVSRCSPGSPPNYSLFVLFTASLNSEISPKILA